MRPGRRNLRIAIIAPPWFELPPSGYGGVEAVCVSLVVGLMARGHTVTVIGPGADGPGSRFVSTTSAGQRDLLGQALPEVVQAAALPSILGRLEVDLVHDHSMAGPLTAAGRAVPTLVTPHPVFASGLLRFTALVPPGGEWSTSITVDVRTAEGPVEQRETTDDPINISAAAHRTRAWRRRTPTLRSRDQSLAKTLQTTKQDLGALQISDPDYPERRIVAAGAPWFMALFGRDSLLTSWMLLLDTSLAMGTLQTLARLQGEKSVALTEEEPGTILHEVRFGRQVRLALGGGEVYYGSLDSSPLFVMLLGEAYPTRPPAPQAWAAASPILLLRSLLDFAPDLPGRLRCRAPGGARSNGADAHRRPPVHRLPGAAGCRRGRLAARRVARGHHPELVAGRSARRHCRRAATRRALGTALVVVHPAPDAGDVAVRQCPLTALPDHRAATAHRLGPPNLARRRPGQAYGEEEFGVDVTAGCVGQPIHRKLPLAGIRWIVPAGSQLARPVS
jgi:hypothetical protein